MDDRWEALVHKCTMMYVYFYRRVTGQPAWFVQLTDKKRLTIVKFIMRLEEEYGEHTQVGNHFMFYYCAYQFGQYARDGEFIDTRRKDLITWIFGPKAWERWLNRNPDTWQYYLYDEGILAHYELTKESAVRFVEGAYKDATRTSQHEEEIKKRFADDPDGRFASCIQYTTLYNPLSTICLMCKYRNRCRKLQSTTYPEIYELRNKDMQRLRKRKANCK